MYVSLGTETKFSIVTQKNSLLLCENQLEFPFLYTISSAFCLMYKQINLENL